MISNRIDEILKETAYPDSRSVHQALLQVWNECEQESNRIHYESKKDAEAKEETRSIKKQINDLLLKMEAGKNCIGETSNLLKDLFDNREAIEESDWFKAKDKDPKRDSNNKQPIVEIKMLDLTITEGRLADSIGVWFDITGEPVYVTHWRPLTKPKEEEQTFITETQTMFIAEVEIKSTKEKDFYVLNAEDIYKAYFKVKKHYQSSDQLCNLDFTVGFLPYEYIK